MGAAENGIWVCSDIHNTTMLPYTTTLQTANALADGHISTDGHVILSDPNELGIIYIYIYIYVYITLSTINIRKYEKCAYF